MPDPIPPAAQIASEERLIAAIERLTVAVEYLRRVLVVDAPEPQPRADALPDDARERATRDAVAFAEQAIATSGDRAVTGAAVLDVMRQAWPKASARAAAAALESAGFRQVRLPGAGRPRAWVRR